MKIRTLLSIAALALGLVQAVHANTKIVVPFAPGGATDRYGRILAAEFSKDGQPWIVESKPGGNGIIGAQFVARSAPNGETIFLGSNSTLGLLKDLYDKLPYDPFDSFSPIGLIGYQPAVLLARGNAPFNNLQELIAHAREARTELSRGSAGAGNLTNFAGILLEKKIGIKTVHVPYNGESLATNALLAGQIDLYVGSTTVALPHIRSGAIKILGVMDARRLHQLPEAPTFQEMGVDLHAAFWYALAAPAGTPEPMVRQLNARLNKIINDPAVAESIIASGIVPKGGTLEEYKAFAKTDYERWGEIIRELGLYKQSGKL